MFAVINPATEEKITDLKEDTAESVKDKFRALKAAQPVWAALPLSERLQCLSGFYDLLETEKDDLARTLTSEMGKPLSQSYNELNGARNRVRFFLDNSERWLSEEWITTEGGTREKITYEPLGIITNISAWNYPYLVGVNVFVPALIGGNAVCYKPSEYASLTGLKIASLLYRSGVPENCFVTVTGSGSVGELLLDLPFDGFYFTGSYKTGRRIAERVASRMVPCQFELGGKDPLYVMDDIVDVDQVAAAALEGVVYNNGQSCCAVERIYVHEDIYDTFLESFIEQCNHMVIGDPMDSATDIGPLSRKEQLAVLEEQVRDAREKGAIQHTGLEPLDLPGYYMRPVVMSNVNHTMKIMKDESFGPVIGIQKVRDDDEAARLMMDTEYGLTAAVYSDNYDRAEKLMKMMHTGTVYWNCCDRVSAGLPWSGRKNSGFGSTLSYSGIRAFVQPKSWHLRG